MTLTHISGSIYNMHQLWHVDLSITANICAEFSKIIIFYKRLNKIDCIFELSCYETL